MKTKHIICIAIAGAIACAGFTQAFAEEKAEKKDKQAKLEAQAKVSKADAEKTALAKVPGGKVKDAEIEEEDGKLIWSFDITKEGSKDITEVEVDAKTGEVLKSGTETPEDEAKEKAEEKEEKDDDKDDER